MALMPFELALSKGLTSPKKLASTSMAVLRRIIGLSVPSRDKNFSTAPKVTAPGTRKQPRDTSATKLERSIKLSRVEILQSKKALPSGLNLAPENLGRTTPYARIV